MKKELNKKEIKKNLSCNHIFIETIFYHKQGKVFISNVLWQKK